MTKQSIPNALLILSCIIGIGSGPFVFKIAGFPNFPGIQLSHFAIIICYAIGAMSIARSSMNLLLRVTGLFPKKSSLITDH